MSSSFRIGLIGLDTSHVLAFCKLLNDDQAEHHIPGARVVAAYPGGSPDWELSRSRVQGYTQQLRQEYGIEIHDDPEAVAEQVDLLFITALDGRRHRALLERLAAYRRPTFIDKPFATSTGDAEAMIRLAALQQLPLMSCSSLRYAQMLTAALNDNAQGAIKGVDVFGPMALEDALPGLFWYGCHCVEMVVAAMGIGCRQVRASANEGVDALAMTWADGRVAMMRGTRDGHQQFGATLHREQGFQQIDIQAGRVPHYAGMLRAILKSLPSGRSDVPHEQMLEVVRIMEAGNEARAAGRAVMLEPLTV